MEDLTGTVFARYGGDPFTAAQPTSQTGGNMQSSNALALTAHGTPPTDPLLPAVQQGNPVTAVENYDTSSVLRDPSGGQLARDLADRSTPYTRADGTAWNTGSDDAAPVSRMMVKRGQWNVI